MIENTLSIRFFGLCVILIFLFGTCLVYAEEPPDTFPPVGEDAPAPDAVPDALPDDVPAADTDVPADDAPDAAPDAVEESVYTIWDKPFDLYTPAEGYLCLLFLVVLTTATFNLFKKGI